MLNKSDKYDFAISLLIGSSTDLEDKAIRNAYTAVQRTFRFKGKNPNEPKNISCAIIKNFIASVNALIEVLNTDSPYRDGPYDSRIQKEFDKAFSMTCRSIVDTFKEYNFDCYYGQAQKWVNITMKHLVLYGSKFNKIIPYLHVPIDNVVYGMVKDLLNIFKPNIAWSRMSENDYNKYQLSIRKAIFEKHGNLISPFEWEWVNWNNKKGI